VIGEAAGNVDLLRNQVTINFPNPKGAGEPTSVSIPVAHLKGMTDPITDSAKLRGFVMPDGTLPPVGTSTAQLMAAGAIPIDTQSESLGRRVSGIGDIVGDMQTVANKLFPTDNIQKRTSNAARYYWDYAVAKKIPEITMISSLNARIGQLVAAMGGETANRLSDADVKRMAEGFGLSFFESKTSSATKIKVIQRGIDKLRQGLLSGKLVGEIQQLGGDPAEAARLLGIDKEFATAQQQRPVQAPPQVGGAQPKGGKPLRGAAASQAVSGTLMDMARELGAEVEAGRLTSQEAEKRLQAAQKAGLPPGEGLPPPGGTTEQPVATGGGGRKVNVGGVTVEITP
jgi:hypothetical protein